MNIRHAALWTLLFFLCTANLPGAILTVTTNADNGGAGTLRSLITAAQSGDTIAFAANLSGATIALTNSSNSGLTLTKNVTIDAMALAQSVQINGNDQYTVFTVNSGVTASLNALTITNGNGRFGGIFNDGTMTLNASTVTGNSGTVGGAIFSDGTMTLNASTVAGNNASGGIGGGIYNVSTMTLNASTVAGNSASEGGGGICNEGNSRLNVTNSIVAGNNADGGGDILNIGPSTITYGGTNLVQSVYNSGFIDNASAAITTTNALLAPLGNYGGPTQTMPPLPGSPAIDAGSDAANTFTTDQRGELRPSGARADIGAVEFQLTNYCRTLSATGVMPLGATLNGSIIPLDLTNKATFTWYFAYGPTTNYGSFSGTNASVVSIFTNISQTITGLVAGATYHYQLFASNNGVSYPGGDLSFMTVVTASTNYVVVNTNDDGGAGSLRAAVLAANGGYVTNITFAANLSGASIGLTNGELLLTQNVTIDASTLPNGVQLNGNHVSRIFEITNNIAVVLTGLTVTNGYVVGSTGGDGYGGGIYNSGTLTMNASTLAGNSGYGGYGGGYGYGGGIYNGGTLTMNASTVTGNNSIGDTGEYGGDGYGGGIYNGGTLTMNASTVAGNNGSGSSLINGSSYGGGIYNNNIANVTNSIIADNTADNGADIVNFHTLIYGGANLVQSQLGSTIGTIPIAAAPDLAPLGNYGGPTLTLPPLPGSPAIDAGSDAANTFITDQRGFARISGAHVDIGAVEVQQGVAVTLAASGTTMTGATVSGTVTPNDLTNNWYFAYGTTTNYGNYSTTNQLSPGTNTVIVENLLTGLTVGTTYHYELLSADGVSMKTGGDQTFTALISAVTTNTLTSSMNPTVFGQAAVFTVNVTSTNGTPAGTVTFYVNNTNSPATNTLVNGGTSWTNAVLPAGNNVITAIYPGDSTFLSSTGMVTQLVNPASTASQLTASPNPATFGQAVTLAARVQVSAPGAGMPAGIITFTDGAAVLGTGVPDTNGIAQLVVTNFNAGNHQPLATYSGAANFNGSASPAVMETVNQATLSYLTIGANTPPTVYGQPAVFGVYFYVSGSGSTPTGTVTFYVNGTNGINSFSTNALVSGLTITNAFLPVGMDIITAVYSGDNNYFGRTAVTNHLVRLAATTNQLSAVANPSVFGQPVIFTAIIGAQAPGAGTPGGTVTFYNGGTILGTNTPDTNGVAILSAMGLPTGTNNIQAVYSGNTNYSSSSSLLAQVVNPAATTNQISTWLNPSVPGQPVTFTTVVSAVAPGAGTPGGAVTFYSGTNSFGKVFLDTNGIAMVTATNLTAGTNAITAVYAGSTNFLAGTSAVWVQTVLNLTNAGLLSIGTVDHTSPHYLQTGLMEQTITVSNASAGDYTAVRVTLHLTQSGIMVYNATGTNHGDAYLEYDHTVPAHTAVTFTVEYYVANRTTIPNPVISITVTAAATPPVIPSGTPVTILQSQMMATNGVSGPAFLLGFKTQAGATYYVEYSGDMIHWNLVLPAIQGNGNLIQWLDVGPPQTVSPPGSQTQRFYQVIQAQ